MNGTWNLTCSEEDIWQKLNLQFAVFIFSIYCSSAIMEIGNGWVKCMDMINLFSESNKVWLGEIYGHYFR